MGEMICGHGGVVTIAESFQNNKTKEIVIPIVVSVSVLVIVVAFILFWKLRRNERSGTSCFDDK